jgi:YD repeat-containing protein
MYAPGDAALADSSRRIRYDLAGNQIKDSYTGYGAATFDAENRISAIQNSFGSASSYSYDGDGKRTGRNTNNQATWQIYGFGGELMAEYGVGGLRKEYGYRNGELLITAEAPASVATTENVSWTNVVGATASGNSLTKTASTAWGNAGASSTKSIVSGDGYVEFTVTSLLTGMVALSHTDANQDYTSMEFALLPNSDGNLNVFESGVNRGIVSSYTTADVFRVAVEGGVVKYRKNGTLVYTSTVAPTYPLLADAGLYHSGGTFSNVVISGSAWAVRKIRTRDKINYTNGWKQCNRNRLSLFASSHAFHYFIF